MSIFSNLFGSSQQRQFKKLREKVHRETSTIANLARVIRSSSIAYGKTMKPHLNFKTEKEVDEQYRPAASADAVIYESAAFEF